MGTEVLRPHDCLVDNLRFSPPPFSRRKSFFVNGNGLGSPKTNTYSNRKPSNVNRPERLDRKRSPTKEFQPQQRKPSGDLPIPTTPRRSRSAGILLQTHVSKPVTNNPNPEAESGRVTILRRGQSLDSLESNLRKGDFNSKSPKVNDKKSISHMMVGADVYAGSAIFVSPSPSSLPLPSFFSNKKSESDVSATRDLRRLLGLE